MPPLGVLEQHGQVSIANRRCFRRYGFRGPVWGQVMRLLLVTEVAEILRVPKGRIYELIRQGSLPAVHIGRLVRVPESALSEWITKGGVPLSGFEEGAH
jgi:excisionase family DNA binding protein